MALSYHAVALGRAAQSVIREAGETQKGVAEKRDIKLRTFSRHLNGECGGPTFEEICKVADATGLTVAAIVERAQAILARLIEGDAA